MRSGLRLPTRRCGGGQRLSEWSETIGGVRFSARPFVILTGSSGGIPLVVANGSDKEVVVLGGQLVTKGRTVEADVPDDPATRAFRTVPAGETKSVSLGWSLGTASKALGPDPTWVWRVRIGGTEHTLRVPMRREDR